MGLLNEDITICIVRHMDNDDITNTIMASER